MKSARTFVVTAFLVAIFLSLANWQWNRAADMKKPIKTDTKIYNLEEIATAGGPVEDFAIHKLVKVSGTYLFTRQAQFKKPGKVWDVSLMATESGGAVLVVRGVTGTNKSEESEATVIGRYFPPQGVDTRVNTKDMFSRIDSSLVVTDTALPLYSGFILAREEMPDSKYTKADIQLGVSVPGYYWQHISYVIIWLLFALVVLYLPRYQRKLDRGK